jgi:hypothetical protein
VHGRIDKGRNVSITEVHIHLHKKFGFFKKWQIQSESAIHQDLVIHRQFNIHEDGGIHRKFTIAAEWQFQGKCGIPKE